MKKIALLLLFACLLCADKPILSPNEALVIDAKTNKINFTLEITKDGKIKKRLLSKSEKDALYKALNAESKIAESKRNMADSAFPLNRLDSANKLDSAKVRDNSHIKQSHIKQWDKKKIIYEQSVYKIEILR